MVMGATDRVQSAAVGDSMTAVRLHGPEDLRVETVATPGDPGPGQVLLAVASVGVCGSDLHTYKDARIGDVLIEQPLILGHEFGATVIAVGADARDGNDVALNVGQRVAVDPAQPCLRCPMCEQGHPNLCRRLHFCGNYPDPGSLCEQLLMPAHSCFPIPDCIDDAAAAMLEPLGVALHSIDLAKIRVADSVAVLGAGCIGLLIAQLARLAGADPVFVTDQYPWRLAIAERYGATALNINDAAGAAIADLVRDANGGGVDVAIEAAWADASAQQAAEMSRLGGRLVITGISEHDELSFKHSTVRRKGLTIRLARRMKHVYPRAIRLVETGKIDIDTMISHRFPLDQAPQAFALNSAYRDGVVKTMIDVAAPR